MFTPHIFGMCILVGLLGFVFSGVFFSLLGLFNLSSLLSSSCKCDFFFFFTISLNFPIILCCKAEIPEASKLFSQYDSIHTQLSQLP